MQFLRRWLRIERSGVALHPMRRLTVAADPEKTFDRCLDGITRVLGGTIVESDRSSGRLEATFGLVFSERLSCTIRRTQSGSDVLIESRRGPRAQEIVQSDYVQALAEFLMKPEWLARP